MSYDFSIHDKCAKETILENLKVLVPVIDNYTLGFKCTQQEYGMYQIKIFLDNPNESTLIYSERYYGYNIDKIKKLLVSTDDKYWNFGLESYRKEVVNNENVESSNSNNEISEYIKEIKNETRPLDGKKYLKYYPYKERIELKKLGYYKYCNSSNLFEFLLARASNYGIMDFKKLKLITLGFGEYKNNISDNVLFYSEYFLSADVIEKIHELSLLDASTKNKLFDIKKMISDEQDEFNRICEITTNKKQENINKLLEAEKIKYMISNGLSLQEAFYYVDKNAQEMKQNVLNCYLSLTNNDDISGYTDRVKNISDYLFKNAQKKDIETIIDHVLINADNFNDENLSDDVLNHISFIKIMLRGEKNEQSES